MVAELKGRIENGELGSRELIDAVDEYIDLGLDVDWLDREILSKWKALAGDPNPARATFLDVVQSTRGYTGGTTIYPIPTAPQPRSTRARDKDPTE